MTFPVAHTSSSDCALTLATTSAEIAANRVRFDEYIRYCSWVSVRLDYGFQPRGGFVIGRIGQCPAGQSFYETGFCAQLSGNQCHRASLLPLSRFVISLRKPERSCPPPF